MPVALAALFTALARAAAPADAVVVAWQVPEACPGVEVLHAGIRRSLGGLAVAQREPVQVEVTVTRAAARRFRLRLRLDVGDGPSERELTTDSCAAAIDTAAWLVAIAIDVRAVDPAAAPPGPPSARPPVPEPPRPGPSESVPAPLESAPAPAPAPLESAPAPAPAPLESAPAPEPAPPEPVEPPPPATDPPSPRPAPSALSPAPPRSALRLDLWAGGGLGLGVLPRLAPAAALGLTLAGARWEVELSGHYLARQRAEFGGGLGGRFVHGHAAARGCGAWERGRVRVPVCGGLALGGLTGEGTGELTPRTARSLWVGLLAGVGLRVRLHPRVGLLVRAEAVFGARRPGFLLEPSQGLVFRPAPVGMAAFLALAVRIR